MAVATARKRERTPTPTSWAVLLLLLLLLTQGAAARAASYTDDVVIAGATPTVVAAPAADSPQAGGARALPAETRLRTEIVSRVNVDSHFDPVDEDVVEWWNLARLRLHHARGRSLTAVADTRLRWGVTARHASFGADFWSGNGGRDGKWSGEVELREGYLMWRRGPIELAAGQRLYSWGKNEVLAPADLLNPRDLRFDPVTTLTTPKDAKRPVFALDAAFAWGAATSVRLVVLPFFASHRAFLVGRDFALAAPGSALRARLRPFGFIDPSVEDALQDGLTGTRTPEETLWQAWTAVRAETTLAGWDLALTIHDGWDRIPRVTIDPDLVTLLQASESGFPTVDRVLADPDLSDAVFRLQDRLSRGDSVLTATYARQWSVAAEAEGVVGDFVLRADVGYTPGQLFYEGDLTPARRPLWSGALGAELTRGDWLFVQLTSYALVALDPPARRLLLLENTDRAAAASRGVAMLWGLAATVRWSPLPQVLEVSMSAAYNVRPGDYAGTARLTYSGLEPHRLSVGTLLLGGPAGTVGRYFGGNDLAFVEYAAAW